MPIRLPARSVAPAVAEPDRAALPQPTRPAPISELQPIWAVIERNSRLFMVSLPGQPNQGLAHALELARRVAYRGRLEAVQYITQHQRRGLRGVDAMQ